MASNKYLTEDEIVSTLAHSSLPTLVVEGKDDMSVYRWIEEDCNELFDIIQCQGRTTLFNIYNRRAEFSNIKVVFVADKDVYVYGSVPKDYDGVIFTYGYSIENDLYFGRSIESLLSKNELLAYRTSIAEFCRYYSLQVERIKNGKSYDLRLMPCKILDDNTHKLLPSNLNFTFTEPNEEIYKDIFRNYDSFIRGHSLFSLLFRIISKRKHYPKYNHIQLYEICYKAMKSEKIKLLIENIRLSFK